MAGPDLAQTSLSSSSIDEIRKVALWLETAFFAPIEVMYEERKVDGILRCEDPEIITSLEPLLATMVI